MKTNTKNTQVQTTTPQSFNIESLISQAVAKDTSVETLERVLALREKLKNEWAKEEFYKAFAELQQEMPIIGKNKVAGTGSFQYKYAPLEVIVAQVSSIIAKHGFSYTFDTTQNGKLKVICKVKHIAGHQENSEFELAIDTNARMNTSQQYGAALTYGKRYAFCSAFGIVVGGEDTDSIIKKEVKQIEEEYLKEINAANTLEELIKVGQKVQKKVKPEYRESLRQEYARRKSELENAQTEDIIEGFEKESK